MNLILFDSVDFVSPELISLRDHRRDHIRAILQKGEGGRLRIGQRNGLMGEGVILRDTGQELLISVHLDQSPPPPLPVTLILALPRPKMVRRILRTISSMGVKSLYLINSYRVDKSYWGSPLLHPEQLEEQLVLGLEQGRDTVLPQVHLYPRFRPFVEDVLPGICAATTNLVAHPGTGGSFPHRAQIPATLAIGPEGGFLPYEIGKLGEAGFTPAHLGSRILSVETAVSVLLSRYIS